MVTIGKTQTYTEAKAEAWAQVTGADLVPIESRRFRPERITVTYDWRTQLNDTEWTTRCVTLAGPWVEADGVTPTGTGSGSVMLPAAHAPEWTQEFAAANVPTAALVEHR